MLGRGSGWLHQIIVNQSRRHTTSTGQRPRSSGPVDEFEQACWASFRTRWRHRCPTLPICRVRVATGAGIWPGYWFLLFPPPEACVPGGTCARQLMILGQESARALAVPAAVPP